MPPFSAPAAPQSNWLRHYSLRVTSIFCSVLLNKLLMYFHLYLFRHQHTRMKQAWCNTRNATIRNAYEQTTVGRLTEIRFIGCKSAPTVQYRKQSKNYLAILTVSLFYTALPTHMQFWQTATVHSYGWMKQIEVTTINVTNRSSAKYNTVSRI